VVRYHTAELSPVLSRTIVGRLAVQVRRHYDAVAWLLATQAVSAANAISDLETLRFANAGLYATEGEPHTRT